MRFTLTQYLSVTWFIFVLIVIAHFIRAVLGFPAVIAGFNVPQWASWIVVVFGVFLAYNAQRLQQENCKKKK